MKPTALVVELTLERACRERFLEVAKQHAERSVRLEPGCISFQVVATEDDTDRVVLVEIYRSRAALQQHWDSVHMAQFRERTEHWVRDRKRHLGDLEIDCTS